MSAVVKNELAEQLGVNEEQLFKLAAENTKRIFPPCVKSMNEITLGRQLLICVETGCAWAAGKRGFILCLCGAIPAPLL